MRVLYFGMYDPLYARNRVLMSGLRQNGVEIIECQDNSPGILKFIRLFRKHWQVRGDYDVMVVGFLGQIIVPFAWLITSKPIIFDAFISLYDSNVYDRKIIIPGSFLAHYYWFLDWLSMRLADSVLFDTNEHISYAAKEFRIKNDKFRRVFVGTDEKVFHPREGRNNSAFAVHFHGSFIPLQGIDCIIKAAKLLENDEIKFNILGDGQTYPEIKKLAGDLEIKNVNFINRVEYGKLPEYINQGNICLGVFGQTAKTNRVIPNKVYEYAAMRKPIITADTPAIRELFNEGDMILIQSNPENLASAILKLKNNPGLRESLADNAYNKFKRFATPEILGRELKQIGEKLL
ncbi:MAG: glycosyltransferase [Patescibacteria group bacterium]|mgnify:CR=1 FL=1